MKKNCPRSVWIWTTIKAHLSIYGLAVVLATNITYLQAANSFWVTGYYPGYNQNVMPASSIDFTTLTHVIDFSVVPNINGSLNTTKKSITSAHISNLVSLTHAAGRKVLICVGGSSSESGFLGATSGANLTTFINNLTNFVAAWGYDGVDIDWEPLNDNDDAQYTNLVIRLRSVLNGFSTPKLLTTAINPWPKSGALFPMLDKIQTNFDQINLMTYDASGPHHGWITWFNAPLYDGGTKFPNGRLIRSVDQGVSSCLSNAIAPGKVGLGIAFYGFIWTSGPGGITGPRQSWPANNPPVVSTPTYTTIMSNYYQPSLYHWDASAQAAYLSITNANAANDMFISFEDQRSCQAKISYARNHGLGGVMIWQLTQDYFSGQPVGQRNPLCSAIKNGLAAPSPK